MKKIVILFIFFCFTFSIYSLEYTHIARKFYEKAMKEKEKENYEKAFSYLNQAVNYDKYNPLIYFELALIYDRYNNTEMAVYYYKKALELRNNNFLQALFNLAYIYKSEKKYNSAIKYFKLCIKKYDDELSKNELKKIYKILSRR